VFHFSLLLADLPSPPERAPAAIQEALQAAGWQVADVCLVKSAGSAARRDRATKRWEAIHRLIAKKDLPTKGRFAWVRIHSLLAPELLLTRKLPPGRSLDTMPPAWSFRSTISPKSLREGYFAWLAQQQVAGNGIPRQS
jgi:hypothetical protein